jgi:LacI family transcriptional regulator
LNGKADQYRISPATQQKIFEAARALNYQPNISARRLRSGGETVLPIIALFWSLDTRAALMGRFLKGLHSMLAEQEHEYELLIQPYEGSKLSEIKSLMTGTRFNGAIIANPTEADEEFLAQASLNVPIVLYQRSSDKYCSVNVDSRKSGAEVAKLFAGHGHKRVGVIVPNVSSKAVRLRMEGFLEESARQGMEVSDRHRIYSDFSEQGGYTAIRQLVQSDGELPTALFIISDQMAVGALMAFHEFGMNVPEDCELIGHDDDEVTRFTIPSLSTVHLPVEEMSRECIRLLTDLIQHKTTTPVARILDTHVVIRGSCRS